MGLLSEGTPLDWPSVIPHCDKVRNDGIEQFLHVYRTAKDYTNHDLKWGDEVEYLLVNYDRKNRRVTLSLRAPQLLPILKKEEHVRPKGSSVPVLWHPEYANWMIESTPGIPYRCYAADLVNVERNMMLRRSELTKHLLPTESVVTLTAFPRTGCAVFTTPPTLPFGPTSRSFFLSDDIINPHPRFPTVTRNIRTRREKKVFQRVPLFIDRNTDKSQPLIPGDKEHLTLLKDAVHRLRQDGTPEEPALALLKEGLESSANGNIVMDATGFGMGSSCLQVTIQGRDMSESRYLYDQLAVMAPLMLALTAATPAVRGLLADTDVRWNIISAAMDDRTPEELKEGVIEKSRYSSITCFMSNRGRCKPEMYNDLPIPTNERAYKRLVEGGVDHLLAQHVAHLFIRDPLVVYNEKLEQDNEKSTDHFENIQSTNWNTVRFKLPPPNTDIGWRTEFRSMEVGVTDFENAAFSVFMILLSRVILAFNLDFYIPMSKVDANMETAHFRNAVAQHHFYFRKNLFTTSDGARFLCSCGHIHSASLVGGHAECEDIDKFCGSSGYDSGSESEGDSFELMTIDEIFNGKPLCRNGQQEGFAFPGLIPLMRGYLDALKIDSATRSRLMTYLDFVSQRASGELCTNASYMRSYIRAHPSYAHDSVVSEDVCYDLVRHMESVARGEVAAPELLGRFHHERLPAEVVESPRTMMARMQREMVGEEAGMLEGESMPRSAFWNTIRSIASVRKTAGCQC